MKGVRYDIRSIPPEVDLDLRRALLEGTSKAAYRIDLRDAFIRGMVLAAEELRKAKPEALRRIYER